MSIEFGNERYIGLYAPLDKARRRMPSSRYQFVLRLSV